MKDDIDEDCGDGEGVNGDNFNANSKYSYILQANAYAIMRTYDKDYQIQSKEAYLGRITKN
jgi:hypothetical protein